MPNLKGRRLILSSNSPRRKELLARLDLDFTIDARTSFIEDFPPELPHDEIPLAMARGKSLGFHRPLDDDEILITADTMVLCGGEILGKPKDRDDAVRMLRLLSGREHKVTTGVVLRSVAERDEFSQTSFVWFKDLSDEEIYYYVDKYKPFDKAGAYGIQEWIGYAGITRIEGSYFNIVGLPVQRVYTHLLAFIG